MSQVIQLTQGFATIVDDDDHEAALKIKWRAQRDKGNARACVSLRAVNGANRKTLFLHTFIMRPEKGFVVDHINGDTLDNRRSNLRVCTNQQNAFNRKISRKRVGGMKGVTYYPYGKEPRWAARICVDGKIMHIGYFGTQNEAAKAYDAEAKKRHGEFAKTNFQ